MKKTRKQLRALVEWAVAAGLLALLIAGGLNLLGQIRRVAPVTQVIALEPDAPVPPSFIPSRAVSVPLLVLAGNVTIQVGEFAGDVISRLRSVAVARGDAIDRGPNGDRTTHEFWHADGRFYLVTESAAAGGAQRVTAIFIP